MNARIAVLAGDGVGKEIVPEAVKVPALTTGAATVAEFSASTPVD